MDSNDTNVDSHTTPHHDVSNGEHDDTDPPHLLLEIEAARGDGVDGVMAVSDCHTSRV